MSEEQPLKSSARGRDLERICRLRGSVWCELMETLICLIDNALQTTEWTSVLLYLQYHLFMYMYIYFPFPHEHTTKRRGKPNTLSHVICHLHPHPDLHPPTNLPPSYIVPSLHWTPQYRGLCSVGFTNLQCASKSRIAI
ncbi:hypothetical protein BU24DRAFT_419189 [Aaosphaeria arxii CBS 175.79]|uniref:Uncharacterized protein n=1 Tax=Aaosphaeria arxii CBS 175.79 TaxID=1450172 RepID=A0A6A5Y289_9PLEO|nr:uncharacterized protein BU24DRAFT_419189 [Aaosphaeria arxii CBS 175.79]KAF2019588.1 hypothetical protein BU24DRAFT_419189 [Aaosphaeria arxii CBS 175.79]